MHDREPRIVDCLSLARRGLWDTARCCRSCHEHEGCEDLELDLGPGGDAGSVRLHLCCTAGADIPLADAIAQCGSPHARSPSTTSSVPRMAVEHAVAGAF